MPFTALSPETALIRDALLAAPVGGTVAYADLSALLGRSVDGAARGVLTSARRLAERDHGAVFEPLRGIGLRRLPPAEAGRIGAAARVKIGRAARRGARAMVRMTAQANDLPPDVQKQLSGEVAALNLIAHLSRTDPAPMQSDAAAPLPPAKAAAAFLRHLGAKDAGTP